MAGKLNHYLLTLLTRVAFMALGLLLIYFIARFAQQQVLNMGETMVDRHQAQREAQQASRQLHQAAQTREREWQATLAARQNQYEADRRRAFDSFYKAPAGCDSPRSERQLKECVNHKMRARRTFFANYDSGPYDATASRPLGDLQYGDEPGQ